MARSRSIGGIYASLSLRDSGFKAGLKTAKGRLKDFARSAPGQIGAGLSFAGIVAGAASATNAASDLYETISKSQVVFGSSSAAMERWASEAANSLGQSKEQALGAAATMGNMFVAMGMIPDEAANMSKEMVNLAADLASFNNTSSDDALMAIGAALRGESEPIRRYGVLLDDATLKAEAFSKGLYDGTGVLAPASRALAAYGVILKQTTTAQGDFAKTSDGLANSQRIIAANFEDAKATLGESLLPTIQKLSASLKELDFQSMADGLGSVVSKTIEWSEALAKVASYIPGQVLLNKMASSMFSGNADPREAAKMAADWASADPAYMQSSIPESYYRDSQSAADDKSSKAWFENGGFAEAMRGVNGFGTPEYGIPEMLANPYAEFSTVIPDILKRVVTDPATASELGDVNSYQSRGLSLDANPTATRAAETQITLLQSINSILKQAKGNKQLNW